MKMQTLLLAGSLMLAPAAWAGNCPNLMSDVDDILEANPDLDAAAVTDEEMGKSVKELRAEGESLHQAGQHAESVEVLERAIELLEAETG